MTAPYPQRRSPRLRDYDYAQSGAYFITICTHQRLHLFGEISPDSEMILNPIGQIAHNCWFAIPEHFPTIELDVFVVMPNHLHGILVLGDNSTNTLMLSRPHQEIIEKNENTVRAFGKPMKGSLSTIIASYKSIVTRIARQTIDSYLDIWQTRFHDHIIRSEHSLNRIRQYTINNPALWREDRFFNL